MSTDLLRQRELYYKSAPFTVIINITSQELGSTITTKYLKRNKVVSIQSTLQS